MKKLSYGLLAVGLLLILLPPASVRYNEWKQERLLAEIERSMNEDSGSASVDRVQAEYAQLSALFEQEAGSEPAGSALVGPDQAYAGQDDPVQPDAREARETATELAEAEQTPQQNEQSLLKQAKAIVEIDKINLKLPVLEGATQENMKFAAAHMTETAAIGEIGNAAIAAHRARKKGRLFNRLDELEIGDQIKVKAGAAEFTYTVFRVSRVEPTDISVLGSNDKDSLLTLITCDPLVNPTHRLIVHAKL